MEKRELGDLERGEADSVAEGVTQGGTGRGCLELGGFVGHGKACFLGDGGGARTTHRSAQRPCLTQGWLFIRHLSLPLP